jgi:phosphate transport system substrate-binding protein
LKLTGPVLDNIIFGKITAWNDPANMQLNPGVSLPPLSIKVIHRSDGSVQPASLRTIWQI